MRSFLALLAVTAACSGGGSNESGVDGGQSGDDAQAGSDGGSPTPDAPPPPHGWIESATGVGYQEVMYAAPSGDVFIASSGVNHRTPDGTWHTEEEPLDLDGERIMEIWGTSATDVWGVGRDGNITHRGADGTWKKVPRFTARNCMYLLGVWGSGPNDVYVGGMSPSSFGDVGPCVLHWDGATWTDRTPPFEVGVVNAIWGTGPGDVWAAGSAANVYHRDATGTWTNYDKDATHMTGQVDAIWASSPTDVYVGGTGKMSHWDGTSWTATTTPNNNYFAMIWGTSATDVYAVERHAVYKLSPTSATPILTAINGMPDDTWFHDVTGTSVADVKILGSLSGADYVIEGP